MGGQEAGATVIPMGASDMVLAVRGSGVESGREWQKRAQRSGEWSG